MTPEQEAEDTASVAPDPRDRRRTEERRARADRRASEVPAPAPTTDGERRTSDRRENDHDRRGDVVVPERYRAGARHMNEYPLLPDEMEFINAINAYKHKHGRPFPTWSEVLHVLKALGYGKPAASAPPPERT